MPIGRGNIWHSRECCLILSRSRPSRGIIFCHISQRLRLSFERLNINCMFTLNQSSIVLAGEGEGGHSALGQVQVWRESVFAGSNTCSTVLFLFLEKPKPDSFPAFTSIFSYPCNYRLFYYCVPPSYRFCLLRNCFVRT
jgi:hypothetical protein